MDGTFSIAPPLFSEVYIVIVEKHGGIHPILYLLLQNKSRDIYVTMFQLIKTLTANANPTGINCDFKKATINAMREVYQTVTIKGCFFLLMQSMQKHLEQIALMAE